MSTHFPESLVFKLDGHAVMFWAGYGATCPTLWTTNGSLDYVASLTAGYIRVHGCRVTESTLDAAVDFTDKASLKAALITAYRAWNASVSSCS